MTDTLLRLYFVTHAIDANADLDLLVWAETPEDALDHWRSYFVLDDDAQPRNLFEIADTAPRAGPLAWHRDDGLRLVTERR